MLSAHVMIAVNMKLIWIGPAFGRWNGFDARRKQPLNVSIMGFANYVESSIGSPREQAEITVNIDGNVDLVIGTQPSGQGHETSFAQVAADLTGIDVKNINIILGDTKVVSVGGGSYPADQCVMRPR